MTPSNSQPHTVLVVEDDPQIADLIRLYLEREAFACLWAPDIRCAERMWRSTPPSLILLDVNLPDGSGIDLCGRIRADSSVPIIFVTCESDGSDVIAGLERGGDDYITKPFDPNVLVARVRAVLRRQATNPALPGPPASHRETYGNLVLDYQSQEVFVQGQAVALSSKERQLLFYFAKNRGRVLSVRQLYEQIWGFNSESDERTVFVHVRNLRKKIEDDPQAPQYIVTLRGFGYRFSAD